MTERPQARPALESIVPFSEDFGFGAGGGAQLANDGGGATGQGAGVMRGGVIASGRQTREPNIMRQD